MTDVFSKEKRGRIMSRIKGKDTRPEMLVRKRLWAEGFRYRLHRRGLPGKPDLVFPKYRAVIFVHGCFWHAHGCKRSAPPSTRKAFWNAKLQGNRERDARNIAALEEQGWRVLVIWECELKTEKRREETLRHAVRFLRR
jgi:DNA mismatch endonuclease (patch repair protein)